MKDKLWPSSVSGQSINQNQFDKPLWRINDLADFLGCAVKAIYNRVSKGEIPNHKRGKFLYFIPAEIITWLMIGGGK